MKRNSKLFLNLSLLALILVVTGCGGGSGGKKTPANSLSSDYFGLQVNYTRNYKGTITNVEESINNASLTWIETVLKEVEPGLFKTQVTASIPGFSESFGDFIEKNEDGNYYDRGWWEEGEEKRYDYRDVIIKNPVELGFESSFYGKIVRKEDVTVPAGTFNAWVFEDTWGDETEGYTDTYYFVPYIGMVKYTSEETEGGKIIYFVTRSLTSYYGSSSASLASPSLDFSTSSANSLKLHRIFRKKK